MDNQVDVLFAYTNINGFHHDPYHFGIGYLSSVIKNNGLHAALVIVNTKRDYKKIVEAVLRYKPKIVGFTSVSSQFIFVADLAKIIKKIHPCIIVCGGVHPTIFPDCIFSAPSLDGIFVGESEFSFLDFALKVMSGKSYRETDNFYYLSGDKLIKNKLRPKIKDIEILPFPDREIYDYQSVINENDGTATIMTNRGCPFNCSYCSNHALAGVYGEKMNATRYNSVEKSLAEIDALASTYQFNKLWFIDDLFILNRKWLDEFLGEYSRRFNFPFMCHIRPDICTKDILTNLKEAKCYKIFIAIESANDYIRNTVMRRSISKTQLKNVFIWAKEVGLETLSLNIIGVPQETESTILETINFNKEMNPTNIAVNIYSPYEGTELGDYCKKNGFLKKNNPRLFFDRTQSTLVLPNIDNSRVERFYNNFQYLIYKDIDSIKAKELLWENRYRMLENIFLFGLLFKSFRQMKMTKNIGRIIKNKLLAKSIF